MDPKQNAATSQSSKSGAKANAGRRKRKRVSGAVAGGEETPITISGGSIVVEFNPDFDDDNSAGRSAGLSPKLKKVKSPPAFPDMRFTRVVIRQGRGGPILNEYPPIGLELSRGCIIEVKGVKK